MKTPLTLAAMIAGSLALSACTTTQQAPASAAEVREAERACTGQGFLKGTLNWRNCVERLTVGRAPG